MKRLIHFLFGFLPRIFNKKGEVQHRLGHSRWNQWKNRYKESLEYNWKRHKGMRYQHSPHKKASKNQVS